jgi:imidazolonepropionase
MPATLLGPLAQVITFASAALKGPLEMSDLGLVAKAGILIDEAGRIAAVGAYKELQKAHPNADPLSPLWGAPLVALPGFIDCHTHACFAGNRALDYDLRIAGQPYLEIARAGGGIWSTVQATRKATQAELALSVEGYANAALRRGVTTLEVKSGYGLSVEQELKMLRAIQAASRNAETDIVATCLAAHICPPDFANGPAAYLDWILAELLPKIAGEKLANRVDIFIEETAFDGALATQYLQKAKAMGFALTVHADQFTPGASAVAVQLGAASADHLESSSDEDIARLAASETVAVALPGASLGLGMGYAPARRLLDAGACMAIASDYNPGSAPMGHLLLQASVLAAAQKLSASETLAALTYRAGQALGLADIGRLAVGQWADIQLYATDDYRQILYWQGSMEPAAVLKRGKMLTLVV